MAQSKGQEVGGFAGWVIRAVKQSRERKSARASAKRMELVETLSLGGKRQVALVCCDGHQFLVGMTADSVTAIAPAKPAVQPQREVPVAPSQDTYEFVAEGPRAAHRLVRFGGGL